MLETLNLIDLLPSYMAMAPNQIAYLAPPDDLYYCQFVFTVHSAGAPGGRADWKLDPANSSVGVNIQLQSIQRVLHTRWASERKWVSVLI